MSDKKTDIFGMANMLIIVAGGIGAFFYLSDGIQGVATKEYHDGDMSEREQSIVMSIEKVELNTLPPRIRPLIELKRSDCIGEREMSPEAEQVLQDLLHRYEELRGAAWNIGTCNDGTWIE